MTKIGVFAVWFVVVIGVTSALDPNCDEFGGCKRTKTNDDNSNHTISEEKQTLNKTISLAIPKKSNTTSEDKNKHPQFMPTLPPKSEEMKGRSLNIENNELTKNTSSNYNPNIADLSDVLLREDDEDMTEDADEDMFYPKIPMRSHPGNMSNGSCLKDDILYVDGETSVEDCDLLCTCTYGEMMCKSRCSNPYIKRGKPIDDPNCSAQESEDICCVKITCNDTTSNSSQTCEEDEKVYVRGERVKDDCEGICYCGHNGSIICKDRCPKTKKPSDKCFELPDPNDRCCKKVVCDVDSNYKILSAKYVNETTIKIEFLNISHHLTDTKPGVDISNDNKTWHTYKLPDNDYLSNIAEKVRYIRVEDDNEVIEIQNLRGPENLVIGNHCSYKEKEYKLNEEFSDGCDLFCVCRENGAKCYKYECPTYSGIDILDPSCVEWETIPANFTPVAPKCCPEKLKCKSHGECSYEAVLYSNWQEIPTNVTGCEKRCYCEMGKVECQEVCPPVIATPPNTLPCLPHLATLKHPPGEDCCLDWVCETRSTITGYPPGYFNNFNGLQNHQQQQDEVVIRTLEPVDSRTVRLVFDIPHIIVGLYGRVEVRYTDKRDNDPSSWSHQVFAPPNDLLATPQLEFQLTQLNPDTEYKIQITVTLRDMHNVHSSKVYNVHTPKDISTSIDAKLKVIEVNSSWARIQWRPFTDYELEFIDGVQLRYKELDGMIFLATPYIHRSVTDYTIENLKNNTAYVVQITFIPFQHQSVELNSDKAIDFTTLDEQNAYNFNVTLELTQVKATSVDIYWNGVPYPQDKYVNVYRTIYQADKSDSSVFKIAKSNSSNKLTVTNLNPGTRYKVWLEMYLTNGKTKISNVLETYTKPGNAPTLGASMKDKLSGEMSEDRGDYYGPLVIVAILATIAILSTLVLLLILLKRHSQNKASITQPPRISQSAYDNPTYKVEIQQETMNL